jgi:hypothetical protein
MAIFQTQFLSGFRMVQPTWLLLKQPSHSKTRQKCWVCFMVGLFQAAILFEPFKNRSIWQVQFSVGDCIVLYNFRFQFTRTCPRRAIFWLWKVPQKKSLTGKKCKSFVVLNNLSGGLMCINNKRHKAWMPLRKCAWKCTRIYALAEQLEKFLNFMQAQLVMLWLARKYAGVFARIYVSGIQALGHLR